MNQPTVIDKQEEAKRQSVLTRKASKILVKFYGINAIPGTTCKKRNEEGIEQAHRTEARDRGLDPNAYNRSHHPDDPKEPRRPKPDTGLGVIQNANGVRCDTLIEQLHAQGYKYTGGHHFFKSEENLKPITVLEFTLNFEGEEQPIPTAAIEILQTNRIGIAHVWANWRNNTDAEGNEVAGQHRVDTVNLNQPGVPSKKKPEHSQQRLIMSGEKHQGWSLVPYEPANPPTTTAPSNEGSTATV